MSKKKSVTLTIDETLWELAKDKLPISRSEFLETQLQHYLNVDDPEQKLIEKISSTKSELNALEEKLCNLRKQKKLELKNSSLFDDAMIPIMRLHSNLGFVAKNQIRNIAHNFDVPFDGLLNHCKSEGLRIENYYELPKH